MAEIINPCNIGAGPEFFTSLKSVLSPIAPNAIIIRNLLKLFSTMPNLSGTNPVLLTIAAIIKNTMKKEIWL